MGAGIASGGPLGGLRAASGSLRRRRKAPMACRRTPGGPGASRGASGGPPKGFPGGLWRPPGGLQTLLDVSKIVFEDLNITRTLSLERRLREIENELSSIGRLNV